MSDLPNIEQESKSVQIAIKHIIDSHIAYEALEPTEKERFKILLDKVLNTWLL